jgi:hypothetical protein
MYVFGCSIDYEKANRQFVVQLFEHHRKRRKPLSKAECEARDAFRKVDAKKALTEHEIAKKAFSDNYQRLFRITISG